MHEQHWQRIKGLFHAAVDVPAADREAWITAQCGLDSDLAAELREMLAAHEEADEVAHEPRASATIIRGYRLLSRLGEGGFGTVHLAEQHQPVHRLVAVKVLRIGLDSDQVVERFAREREALARMRHPCIAQIYDAGTTSTGAPFFAMEYVDGSTLTDYCEHNGLTLDRRLRLFVHVCRGVHHAHQKGVIHRDLKPSNVLVTTVDGAPAPKIIDFGIAKAMRVDGTPRDPRTLAGSCFGTPGYMSPEQIEQDGGGDVRSDVYALGVMLFELLTDRLPHDPNEHLERGLLAFLQRVRDVEPPRPSAVVTTNRITAPRQASAVGAVRIRRNQLRGDLDWIVLKALERDPERRYQSADDIAEDLDRHLRLEPVSAGPPDLGYRLRKFVRRHRAIAGAGAAVLLSLVLGLAVALWQNGVAHAALRESTGHRLSAQALNLLDENPTLALLLAVQGAERAAGEDADAALYRALEANHLLGEQVLHDGVPYWGARSADGSRIVTADDTGLIVCCDLASGAVLTRIDLGERMLRELLVDRTGHHGLAIDEGGTVFAMTLSDGVVAVLPDVPGTPRSAAYLPDGSCLIACADGGLRRLIDGQPDLLATVDRPPVAIAASPDGRSAAVMTDDDAVVEVDLENGSSRTRADATDSAAALRGVGALHYSDDGTWLVARLRGGAAHAFHRTDPGRSFCVADSKVADLALAGGCAALAVSRIDGECFVVDLVARTTVPLQQAEDSRHTARVAIDQHGATVVQVLHNRPLASICDAVTGRQIALLRGDGHALYEPLLADDGQVLVVAGHNGTLHRWRTSALEERRGMVHTIARGEHRRLVVLPHRDSILVEANDRDGTHQDLVDASTGSVRRRLATTLPGAEPPVVSPLGDAVLVATRSGTQLLSLPDGRVLFQCPEVLTRPRVNAPLHHVVGMRDGAVRVHEVGSGRLLRAIAPVAAQYVDVDARGTWVAAAEGGENRTRVWSVATGELVRELQHTAFAFDTAFTADGDSLLVFTNGRRASVVDIVSGKVRHDWQVPTGDFGFVRIGPGGRYAALWTEQVALVHDLRDGSRRLRWEPAAADRRIAGVAFDPDDSAATVRLQSGALLRVPTDPLAAARRSLPRELTPAERFRYGLPPSAGAAPPPSCARPAISTAFSLVTDPNADAADERRAFELLQQAASLREHLPGWFHQTRCIAYCRRAERHEGRFEPADLEQALADLGRYAASPRASSTFLRSAPVLAPLRRHAEFEQVLQAAERR